VVPDNYEFPAIDGVTPMHTEVNLMHVSPTDFHWSATVKYSDVTVETLTIPFKSIL
jgi:hypothetical protein